MIRFIYPLLLLLSIVCLSCQDTDQFKEFDSKTWKNDKMACHGKRQNMQNEFEKIRQRLKGLDQMEVIEVLGKPDFQRLDDRHTKSYLYFLEPGSGCPSGKSNAQTIIIHFSSVDRVFEIVYEQGTPL